MRQALKTFDPYLLLMAGIASFVGLVFVFDAGYARSVRDGSGPIPREFVLQIVWLGIAACAGVLASRLRVETLAHVGKALWAWTLALLVLAIVPGIGYEMGGAHRWIKIGPLTIQPAEIAKLTVILYLAYVLATRKSWPSRIKAAKSTQDWLDRIVVPKFQRFWPGLVALVGIGLIAIEPDLGTAAVVAFIAWVMFAIGGATRKSMVLGTLACLAMCWVAVRMEPYRLERITNHNARWTKAQIDSVGFQTAQAEIGIASGSFGGVGFTAGRVKHIIPAPTTDFITATIAEETGFVGWLAVAVLLGAMTVRLFQLAMKSATRYGAYVVAGVATWIGIQSVVNMTMANGFLPAIGIPLPFVSSGGSSLVALWLALGISQAAMKPATQRKEEPVHEADRHGWRHRRTRLSGA